MNEEDIEAALGTVLLNNLAGLPSSVAWPNVDHNGAVPFLQVLFTGGERIGGALKGGSQILKSNGLMQINIVTEQGGGADPANAYADIVAGLYPEGTRLSITGGEITVLAPPSIRKGFEGDKGWIVPVVIRYGAAKV